MNKNDEMEEEKKLLELLNSKKLKLEDRIERFTVTKIELIE